MSRRFVGRITNRNGYVPMSRYDRCIRSIAITVLGTAKLGCFSSFLFVLLRSCGKGCRCTSDGRTFPILPARVFCFFVFFVVFFPWDHARHDQPMGFLGSHLWLRLNGCPVGVMRSCDDVLVHHLPTQRCRVPSLVARTLLILSDWREKTGQTRSGQGRLCREKRGKSGCLN